MLKKAKTKPYYPKFVSRDNMVIFSGDSVDEAVENLNYTLTDKTASTYQEVIRISDPIYIDKRWSIFLHYKRFVATKP
jgi:hypothetical protein